MVHSVDNDPVSALMGADRDGLLTYHGFAAGGQYEVDLAGRRMKIPTAAVVATVERLRAIERIAATGVPAQLVKLNRDGSYLVAVGGEQLRLPAGEVIDWSAGYVAAYNGRGQAHAGPVLFEVLEAFGALDDEPLDAFNAALRDLDRVAAAEARERLDAAVGVVRPAGVPDAAYDVFYAVVAHSRDLISGPDYDLLTGPWVAAGLPLPADPDGDGEDRIAAIAEVLERPGRDDQCRMVILGLMHGHPGGRVSAVDLAAMIGKLPGVVREPVKKTVGDALMFGEYLGSDLAENMIAALGTRWWVTAEGGTFELAGGEVEAKPLPQMPGLVALRRILAASNAGWLRYVDEPAPNKARWKADRDKQYALTVGQRAYVVGWDSLLAWLDGVAGFHAGGR